jgi:hypothetical protein
LRYWGNGEWIKTFDICDGPYSIVPDPSKPKVDEYEKDKEAFIRGLHIGEQLRAANVAFLEKHFQRKEAK